MRLHAARAAGPCRAGSRQCRPEAEVGVVARHFLKLGAIEKIRFVADAEQQRVCRRAARQIGFQHRTEGSDAGAGGNHESVTLWDRESEGPERRRHLNHSTRSETEQVRRKRTVLDDVQAQLESTLRGRRGDRVGAGDDSAVDRVGERYELSRRKFELRVHGLEDKVTHVWREFGPLNQLSPACGNSAFILLPRRRRHDPPARRATPDDRREAA